MPVLISLNRSFQFLTAYRAFSDFRLVEQEVDDLVLIKRRAKLGCGHWLLLAILDEAPAILGIIFLRGLHDEAVHFGLTDLTALGLAALGKQQAPANRKRVASGKSVPDLVDAGGAHTIKKTT